MGQILEPIYAAFKHHKLKMLATLLVAVAFLVVLFPNDDLSDYLSMQVARKAGIYMEFGSLSFSLLPPGVSATEVAIEPPSLPALRTSSFRMAAAIGQLLTAKLGFSAGLQGLFRGDVQLDYAQSGKTKSGIPADVINLKAERINIDDLCDYLRVAGLFGFKLQGGLDLLTDLRLDQGFAEQPSGSLKAIFPTLTIPSQTVMLDMNGVRVPQQLPTIEFGRVSMNIKINEGVIEVQEAAIGGPGKEISGKVKGTVGLQFVRAGGAVVPQPGGLDLAMDLTLEKAFLDRNRGTVIGGFLILMDQYKQETAKGTRYAIRMKMPSLGAGATPQISPLSEKL